MVMGEVYIKLLQYCIERLGNCQVNNMYSVQYYN